MPLGCQQAAELPQPGLEEAEVVVEGIGERRPSEHASRVTPSREARPVAVGPRLGGQRQATLPPAGVEGRVGVDEVEAAVGEAGKHVEVVPEEDQVLTGLHAPSLERAHAG